MKEKAKKAGNDNSGVRELNPLPAYIQDRLDLWDKLKIKYNEELASKDKTSIKVTLPDGKEIDALAWKTTVYDVARGIRYEWLTLVR